MTGLLAEQIEFDPAAKAAQVSAVLYGFAKPQWVSAHHESDGEQLGPLTVVPPSPKLKQIQEKKFPRRSLAVAGRDSQISHRTSWTLAAETVYTLTLPQDFVAAEIRLRGHVRELTPKLASGSDGRLFYYATNMEADEIEVEALALHDQRRARRLVESERVVKGTNGFVRLARSIPIGAITADFLLQLVE